MAEITGKDLGSTTSTTVAFNHDGCDAAAAVVVANAAPVALELGRCDVKVIIHQRQKLGFETVELLKADSADPCVVVVVVVAVVEELDGLHDAILWP